MSKKTVFQKRPKSMIAINKKLWVECQAWARRTYDVHPSAYSNSGAVKRYNAKGGKWRKPAAEVKKKAMDLNLKIKESDILPPFSLPEAKVLADRMNIDLKEIGVEIQEFLDGLNVELEHQSLTDGDPSDTAQIALDHLKEDPAYYSKLKKMESKAAALDVVTAKPLGGLGHWHKKEKWVDISRKDESGRHPPCGRSDASKGAAPRCRPTAEAAKLSPAEKKKESDKKRRTERTKTRKGKKPHMVKFDYMKKASVEPMSDDEFWAEIEDEVRSALSDTETNKVAHLTRLASHFDASGDHARADAADQAALLITAGIIDYIRNKIENARNRRKKRYDEDDKDTSPPKSPQKLAAGIVVKMADDSMELFEINAVLDAAIRRREVNVDEITKAILSKLTQARLSDAVAAINKADFSSKYTTARKLASDHGLLS